ncbi:DUF2075 domain-containing protein [Acetobacter suratthaniensis]|uniref:DUF2075 domain-containing protein n=1 Tax=Acetobacter suratthaniensis TaxID=1502841 RepID=A0ABS3LL44_9PROT|nr:DUF2075 domain-containing protein [Acetobacter suratthaniensis]MBO1327778.1 DUF2075 domain-containing protein [Acetobacter suratthaniensis]MCX2565760.1 DUF2075 domain-containing protein [Acetobacter suratthaniensis]
MSVSDNRADLKLAPDRALTAEQEKLVCKIVAFCQDHEQGKGAVLVLQGDAGTGKSVVMNAAFARLRQQAGVGGGGGQAAPSLRFLVNHPEMIKLYRRIAEDVPGLRKRDYERPTTFINQSRKTGHVTDIVFVDEAHLLLSRRDAYNRFLQDNQLEEILRASRVVVMVFDPRQVLKFKSFWSEQSLHHLLGERQVVTYRLTTQFRMCAHADVSHWIEAFCQCRLLPLPAPQPFDFRIFEDAQTLYETIRQHEAEVGLCRMLATYDYPYVLNGQDHFITEGRFHLRWDRSLPEARLPWAERADTIDEVGSVYTVQGFDLNYVGLILGPSVDYDAKTDRIILDTSCYEDSAAFAGKAGIENPAALSEQIMLNALNVLMTRPTKGLYLYASRPALRQRLLALWQARGG